MVVSLALFTMVAVVAVGALLKIMDANRKSITLKTAVDNMNYALDAMSREIRVGNNYWCVRSNGNNPNIPVPLTNNSDSCLNTFTNEWIFAFNSSKACTIADRNVIYAYRFVPGIGGGNGTLQKFQQDPASCDTAPTIDRFVNILSDDIDITESQADLMLGSQPSVVFYVKGYSGLKTNEKTSFKLQTTVSQRIN